jgi:hypothetical protein
VRAERDGDRDRVVESGEEDGDGDRRRRGGQVDRKWLLVVGMFQATVAKGSSCTIIGRMLVPATVRVGKLKLAAVAVSAEPLLLINVSSTISRPWGLLLGVSGAIGR